MTSSSMRNRVVLFSVAAAVDSFLCRQLDTLETKVPVMKEPPNEVRFSAKLFRFFGQEVRV
jgi:hypothetical protein